MEKYESNEEFLARLKKKVKENLEAKLDFGEKLIAKTNNGLIPFPAQLMRVYEAIENGTERIMFADGTGFGKTYVASMILGLLNSGMGKVPKDVRELVEKRERAIKENNFELANEIREEIRKKNYSIEDTGKGIEIKNLKPKRHKTLLIAPKQSTETAWTQDEINNYIAGLGLETKPLKITEINRNNLDGILRGNDIIQANYHKFNCGTCDKYVDTVLKIVPKIDLIIFDECQNNRSFFKRGNNIKKLIDKTKNKRILLLSATPGYNGLEDLGIPLHILRPRDFSFAPYDYNSDPTAIKDLILSGQWFNADGDTISRLFNLPPLIIEKPVYCDIGEYAKNYLEVWKNGDLDIGTKIAWLRKFSLLGKLKSKEGKKCLQELLESFPKDHALVTFTHLKTGVSEELFNFLEEFYGKGKVAMINGDVPEGSDEEKIKRRIEISKRFTDGEFRAIANSFLTMGEGAPCTTGSRPARVLLLEMPYNHGQGRQATGRVHRPRQEAEVRAYYIIGENKWLSAEMTKLVEGGELERKYDIEFPRDWRPSTLDLDIYEIMLGKDKTNKERVEKGLTMSEIEQAIMNFRENSKASVKKAVKVGILKSLPIKVKEKESLMSFFTRKNCILYGVGEKNMYKASKNEGEEKYNIASECMVKAYIDPRIFKTSAGDTARLIKQIVDDLEKKGAKFNDLLDEGSGTGVISRVLGREMINLDLDERMLYPDRYKPNREFFGIGKRVQGFMTKMPLDDKSFDLAIASYSIFYNQQKDNEREIEKILIETNRVLRNKGYAIFSLERTAKEEDFTQIKKAIEKYGFNVLISDFFYGYKENNRKSDFKGAYLIVARKKTKQDDYIRKGFSVYTFKQHGVPRRNKRKILVSDSLAEKDEKIKKFKEVNSHYFKTENGISLDSLLARIRV